MYALCGYTHFSSVDQTTSTIQDSDLTDQALMPITIAVVSVSSVVLAILVMYSLCLKCCENKGKT